MSLPACPYSYPEQLDEAHQILEQAPWWVLLAGNGESICHLRGHSDDWDPAVAQDELQRAMSDELRMYLQACKEDSP